MQADADSFYTACNGRRFNSIEDAVCQLVYVERAEVIKSEEVRLTFDHQRATCLSVSNLSFPLCLLSSMSSGSQSASDGADRAAKVHRVPGEDGRVG